MVLSFLFTFSYQNSCRRIFFIWLLAVFWFYDHCILTAMLPALVSLCYSLTAFLNHRRRIGKWFFANRFNMNCGQETEYYSQRRGTQLSYLLLDHFTVESLLWRRSEMSSFTRWLSLKLICTYSKFEGNIVIGIICAIHPARFCWNHNFKNSVFCLLPELIEVLLYWILGQQYRYHSNF